MLGQGWGSGGEWGNKPDPARATPTPQEDSIRAVMADAANASRSKKDNACTWKMMQFCPDPMIEFRGRQAGKDALVDLHHKR